MIDLNPDTFALLMLHPIKQANLATAASLRAVITAMHLQRG